MGLKKTENQVQVLLKDTILALCRNTLNYHAEICIEGLLCITLDCEEVLLVNINQIIKNREPQRRVKKRRRRAAPEESSDEDDIFAAVSPKAKYPRIHPQKSAVVAVMNEQYHPKHLEKSATPGTLMGSGATMGHPEISVVDISNNIVTSTPSGMTTTMSNNVKTTEYVESSNCRLQGSVVKEEPPDVAAIGKELHKHEISMLSPNENEMCQTYLSGSFQANVFHEATTLDGATEYQRSQNQGQVAACSDDVLPNLNHALGGVEMKGSFGGASAAASVGTGHSGQTPHVCLLCGKSFAWQWLLKRHQVVHSGDKDYSCEHCQRTFSYQSSVKRHQEKCSARLENLQENLQENMQESLHYSASNSVSNNPQGGAQAPAYTQGCATSQSQVVYSQIKTDLRPRYSYPKGSCNTTSGAISE